MLTFTLSGPTQVVSGGKNTVAIPTYRRRKYQLVPTRARTRMGTNKRSSQNLRLETRRPHLTSPQTRQISTQIPPNRSIAAAYTTKSHPHCPVDPGRGPLAGPRVRNLSSTAGGRRADLRGAGGRARPACGRRARRGRGCRRRRFHRPRKP